MTVIWGTVKSEYVPKCNVGSDFKQFIPVFTPLVIPSGSFAKSSRHSASQFLMGNFNLLKSSSIVREKSFAMAGIVLTVLD